MAHYPAIAAARERSEHLDALLTSLAGSVTGIHAVVALGAYGRRQLPPHADAEVLFLHSGDLTAAEVTQRVCYPIWEQAIRVEPLVRTPAESEGNARRSWSAAARFLDARLVTGSRDLFEDFVKRTQTWRRDREWLRHRLRTDLQRRHSHHRSVTASSRPDLVAGRGGLLDLQALSWLQSEPDERTVQSLDFLLEAVSSGKVPLEDTYRHARWVAFSLDSALAPERSDRQLGPSLSLRRGELVADRPPPLNRAPGFGLRVANMVGLAPPSAELLAWAASVRAPIHWDPASLEQLWLLLRAADWRAWEFLDVCGLLTCYLPEFDAIWRKPGSSRTGDMALDHHSFLALRSLHEWIESDDPLARRAWRMLRHHDWAYLAVLLHELNADAAVTVARRLGVPDAACDALELVVDTYGLVTDTATRRDLQDEDLVLELATRIGTRQTLSMVFLVAVAHELAAGSSAWSAWKADLMRQLFGQLETTLRQSGELGQRRQRSVDQYRDRLLRELERRNLMDLAPHVARLPRRYLLMHTPAFAVRHLALLGTQPLRDGEVRMQAHRHRQAGLWDVLIVARDRPGLLAMVAGVLSLRGASVLAADAATSADGLVLDVFTVSSADTLQWSQVEADLRAAFQGRIPLHDLLGSRPMQPDEAAAVEVAIDNSASQFFSVVEIRAPDQVGLLYRIASALHALGLDIHHARIATNPDGAFDVFYVRDLSGEKLSDSASADAAASIAARLRTLE